MTDIIWLWHTDKLFYMSIIFSPSSRNGRLFYVYTDKTTSTVLTTTLCYVTGATPTACSGRKKRGVWMDNMDLDVDVAASPVE